MTKSLKEVLAELAINQTSGALQDEATEATLVRVSGAAEAVWHSWSDARAMIAMSPRFSPI